MDIGSYHPIIVHFAIAMLVVGVLFRVLSLLRRCQWARPAAAALLIAGALTAVLAVQSGTDAHEATERIPGARPAVQEHEEWGERTRNLFLLVAAIELAALVLRNHEHRDKLLYASALIGIVGLAFVYETAEHGGELVYSYAGGVGTRSGAPADTERLLIAGLYHQAMRDRQAGDGESAARLIEEMHRRRPEDTAVQLLWAESLLRDRGQADEALAVLDQMVVPESDRFGRYRRGMLLSQVYEARGDREAARAEIEKLLQQFPDSERLQRRLQQLAESAEPES